MKHLKVLMMIAITVLFIGSVGCSGGGGGGGGGDYDTCITKAKESSNKQAGGQMPADALKTASEMTCAPCKENKDACKTIIDALK